MSNTLHRIARVAAACGLLLCPVGMSAQGWSYPETTQELPYAEGLGTVESPYLINSAQQLANLSWHVNHGSTYEGACFALSADIDLNPGFTFLADGTVEGEGEPQAWVPIGHDWEQGHGFLGNFDGRGHTVSGLYLDLSSYSASGLFGTAGSEEVPVEIKDVHITNSYAMNSAFSDYCYAGFLVGYLQGGGVLSGCSNEGHALCDLSDGGTQSYAVLGGLVGYLRGEAVVEDCRNGGSISLAGCEEGITYAGSLSRAGGIVGYSEAGGRGEFVDCVNTGEVNSSGVAGGIVGYGSFTLLSGLENSAAVTAGCYAGGIIGNGVDWGSGISVERCANRGNIVGRSAQWTLNGIGGIAGSLQGNDAMGVSGCSNSGDVSHVGCEVREGVAGGLFGHFSLSSGEMDDCHNTGAVASHWYGGGLVGNTESGCLTLVSCSNTGDVIQADGVAAPGYFGGLFGRCYNSAFTACSNQGTVSAASDMSMGGGLCAEGNGLAYEDCRNEGRVSAYQAAGLGYTDAAIVRGSSNAGMVEGQYAYGLVHRADTIAGSHNEAMVRAMPDAGHEYGYAAGLCYDAGCVERCCNTGDVEGYSVASGLVEELKGVMSNCYVVARVASSESVGGLVWRLVPEEGRRIAHSFSMADVQVLAAEGGSPAEPCVGIVACAFDNEYAGRDAVGFVNCHYLQADGFSPVGDAYYNDESPEGLSAHSAEDFASGRVCVLLNADQAPAPWGQTLERDAYPLLNGGGNPGGMGISAPVMDRESLEGRPVYDLQGRPVSAPLSSLRGIYVVGGQKVLLP